MQIAGLFNNAKATVTRPAGGVIFEAGSTGDSMFGIVEGEVELRFPGGGSRRLGPGDAFGEMAVIDASPRSATAVAVTDVTLAPINRRTFLFLVQETPMFAIQVMSAMAERLRELTPTGTHPKG